MHYLYGDLAEYSAKYDVGETEADGWNVVDGEEIFFVSNPGLGLWAYEGTVWAVRWASKLIVKWRWAGAVGNCPIPHPLR